MFLLNENIMSCFCFGKNKYEDATLETSIPFVPDVKEGKVIKVYDGDTITIATYVPGSKNLYRFSVRLNGIDTPEMKTHNLQEKQLATKARDALSSRIYGKVVQLKEVSFEKYGRLLATVMYNNENMNQWMLDEKHAVPYNGGTKQRPASWDA